MAAYRRGLDAALTDIGSRTAFLRGQASDQLDKFKADRKRMTGAVRAHLAKFAAGVESTVGAEMKRMAASREAMSERAHATRQAYLRDLRKRVARLIADAERFIDDLAKDRLLAARTWRKRMRVRPRAERTQRVAKASKTEKAAQGDNGASKPAKAKTSRKKKA